MRKKSHTTAADLKWPDEQACSILSSLTCVHADSDTQFLARLVRNPELFRLLQDVQREVGDLCHVTVPIAPRQTATHHVRVANRFHLRRKPGLNERQQSLFVLK